MKKSLILGILGLAAVTASTYGQGAIQFNSYVAQGGSGILTYLNGVNGTVIPDNYTAALLYSTSPIVDSATTDSGSAALPLNAQWTVAGILAPFSGGYFQGSNFVLPGGTDGQTVYFEVIAYLTSADSYDNSTIRGHSAAFTGVLKVTPNTPITMDNMQPFSVFTATVVPEPTTLALAGLGGLASLVMLRRKNA